MTHPFISELLGLNLHSGDWALFGSGPLLLRGWIDQVNDLDIISRGQAWDRARELGRPKLLSDGNTIVIVGTAITVGTSWAYGDFDIDELIDHAERIDDVPCVALEHIVTYKRIAARPKDLEHLAVIEAKS